MKRWFLWVSTAILAIVFSLGIVNYLGYQKTHVKIAGEAWSKDISFLDLTGYAGVDFAVLAELPQLENLILTGTGITPPEYDALQAALPNCHILWDVPFQGGFLPSNITELTLCDVQTEDVAQLSYFSQLQTVDATQCKDYPLLESIQQQYPQCDVVFTIALGGAFLDPDVTQLRLTGADAEELERILPYLHQLTDITFAEPLPDADLLYRMLEGYPQINFDWEVTLCGMSVARDTTQLDLSGIVMESTDAVEYALTYLPSLTQLQMCDCGISNEAMDSLRQQFPNVKIVWNVQIGRFITIRTDTVAFAPVKFGYSVTDSDLYNLRYCSDLQCLDLGHMPITDCSVVAYLPHLKYLILADTGVTDITAVGTLKELVYLEIFLTNIKDVSPLVGCTALEDLNMAYVRPNELESLCEMTWLNHLWYTRGTWLSSELDLLHASLPNTQITGIAFYSTDDGWRQLQNYFDMRDLLGMPYYS